ncbi:MAG: polysaccharide pyruvyl transferase family protein [bacterium]|nr:polysaccharide pyruvyl transferase family protein [bacterium]
MKSPADLSVLIDRIPFAEGNVGEEAILASLLQDLQALGINRISVLSNMPERTAARHGESIRVYHDKPGKWVSLPLKIRKADLLIWGGGHMLQDRSSQLYIPYVTKTLILARMLGVPRFIYAPGLGPVINKLGKSISSRAIGGAAGITVRDQGSADLLAQIGISRGVQLTADPVYSLTTPADALPPPSEEGQPIIGFAPRRHFYRKGSLLPVSWQMVSERQSNPKFERFLQETAAALDKAAAILGARIHLIPMDIGPNPRDDLICHRIKTLMVRQNFVRVFDDDPPLNEFIRRLSELNLLISDRLHGIILGMRFGLPFIGIDSDGKIVKMASGIGYNQQVVEDEAIERDLLFDLIDRTLKNRQETRQDLQRHGMDLRRKAQENRLILQKCMQNL